jgi:FkbM family methyltransferase
MVIAALQRKIWPEKRMLRIRRYLALAYSRLWRLYMRRVFGETVWISVDNGRILVRTEDFRAYRIARMRGTQKGKIGLWKEMARNSPEICIDVGANYGEFVAAIAGSDLPVVAIEANHMLASCLKTSFANRENVTILHIIASDTDGVSPFYFNPQSSGSGSLSSNVPGNQIKSNPWGGAVERVNVPSRKLETLIPEIMDRLPECFIMKVDVEGFEESVFRGATSLLENAVWWRALVEFNPTAIRNAGNDPDRVWGMLRVFPGVVIGARVEESEPFSLDHPLPAEAPSFCDVIIGQGNTGDREVRGTG